MELPDPELLGKQLLETELAAGPAATAAGPAAKAAGQLTDAVSG